MINPVKSFLTHGPQSAYRKLYGQEAILENVKVKQGLTFTDTYMQSLLYIANL